MPELEDIFIQSSREEAPKLYEGIFATTPDGVSEPVLVTIPSIDSTSAFGPCPWAPRILEDGKADMPTKGDTCLVALASISDDGGENAWVLQWWPYD